MATPVKKIKDWQRILIDTTVLFSLLRSEKSEAKDSHDLFVRKLIEYLGNTKTSDLKERTFLISSVTVAEIVTNEEDSKKISRLMKVLDSRNVEFVDFDLEVSIEFNSQLKNKLSHKSLHERAKEIGFSTNDYAMAREWVTKDYMIAMCGIVNASDVILTADKNTFYPILKDVPNSNCVLTYSELFDQSEQHILGYKEKEIEEFLKTPKINPPPKIKTTIEIDTQIDKIITNEGSISEERVPITEEEESAAETSEEL